MKDMFGTEIEVGDTLIYPVRRSSILSLKYGRVTSLEANSVTVAKTAQSKWEKDGRPVHISETWRSVIYKKNGENNGQSQN